MDKQKTASETTAFGKSQSDAGSGSWRMTLGSVNLSSVESNQKWASSEKTHLHPSSAVRSWHFPKNSSLSWSCSQRERASLLLFYSPTCLLPLLTELCTVEGSEIILWWPCRCCIFLPSAFSSLLGHNGLGCNRSSSNITSPPNFKHFLCKATITQWVFLEVMVDKRRVILSTPPFQANGSSL